MKQSLGPLPLRVDRVENTLWCTGTPKSLCVSWKTTPRARGGVTMAPLQLRLEPTEVVLATDKGAARARVERRQHR
eukprot:scaffold8537_cov146-Isochrysis_galbana.AAC.2